MLFKNSNVHLIIYIHLKSALFRQSDAHRAYGDEALLIEVAYGTLVNLLAHVETLVDVVGLALVAKIALAVVVQKVLVEGFGEIGSLLDTGLLQGDVNLSVRTNSSDVAFHLITRMDVLEDLVLIEETRILVVDDNLEAEVCLLPDEEIHLVTMLVVRMVFVEITLNLGRGNDAIALLVDVDMHDVGVAEHHAFLLLTEWAEDVLHQPPAQEGSVFVDPFHFEIGEIAYLSQWGFGGRDEALILIEIDEDVQLVADACVFWDVAGWKEDLSLVTTIEIQSEIYFLYDAKAIVIAEFYLFCHIMLFSRI